MKRREFIRLLGGAAVWPLAAQGQTSNRKHRLAVILGFPQTDPQTPNNLAAFNEGLNAVGLEEGRNLVIDYRWPGIDPTLARAYAKELIALEPDVIVAGTNQVVTTVMQETQTVPVVFVYIGDPIGSRYAETLARPGKNLTGFANFEGPIGGKWVELLKEVSPETRRVGFVYHPAASPHVEFLQVAKSSAPSFGLELTAVPVTSMEDIQRDIPAFAGAGPSGGIVVAPHALTLGASGVIADLARRHRLPGVYGDRIFAQRGGLMSFGINPPDQLRRAAGYVRRILNGEKPADLPVQLPIKYETIINARTAGEFGLNIPQSVLVRADIVIE
jgi:putative ABC transport system substrate-binding protein